MELNINQIRPSVLEFAEDMEKKLSENDHKKHWNDCNSNYLYSMLQEEFNEVSAEIFKLYYYFNSEEYQVTEEMKVDAVKELADLANICHMLADQVKKDNFDFTPKGE